VREITDLLRPAEVSLLRSCVFDPELLCQLSYRSRDAPGGTRTRDRRFVVDNRTDPARSRRFVAVMIRGRDAESNR